MAEIKSLARIVKKWTTVTPGRQDEYIEGVKAPRRDWETETIKAEAAYEAGLRASLADKRFGSGVKRVGSKKWKEKTLSKGPGRWAEGVSISGDDYARGFGPYAEVIAGLILPPRKATGDPANIARVAIIAKALHDKKLSMGK